MESLYRKYRPLTFESVVGQQHIVSTLQHAVAEGRLSHAYLFCGPRGTGKTTMARILAKALLCEHADAARSDGASGCMPDGTCPECVQIAEGTHPDVYELDAASRTGVDSVREEIISSVNFAPVRGAYKVYIIDEVHMLTAAAFNALLKTLEEPPAHVVFILCTTDPQKILETILSRCQRFDFHRIGDGDIERRLAEVCQQEGFEYDEEALQIVARHARGGMRDALSSLEQLSVFGAGKVCAEEARALLGESARSVLAALVEAIAKRDIARLYEMVKDQVESGSDVMGLTRDMVSFVRDLYTYVLAEGRPQVVQAGEEELKVYEGLAQAFETPSRIARVLTTLDTAAVDMRFSTDARLVLEMALTRLARPETDLTLEALAERVDHLERMLAGGITAAPMDAAVLTGRVDSKPASRAGSVGSASAVTAAATPASSAPAPAVSTAPVAPAPAVSTAPAVPAPTPTPAMPPAAPVSVAAPVASTAPVAPAAAAATPAPASPVAAAEVPSAPAETPSASSTSLQGASSIPTKPASAALQAASGDEGALQRRWGEVVRLVTQRQASRGALLQNARATSDDGVVLTVGFPAGSSFALKMIERPDSQAVLMPVVQEVFGAREVCFTMGSASGQSAAAAPATSPAAAPTLSTEPTPAAVEPAAPSVAPAAPQSQQAAVEPAAPSVPPAAPQLQQADVASGPTIVPEADIDAQRAAWEQDTPPYDDATIAAYTEDDAAAVAPPTSTSATSSLEEAPWEQSGQATEAPRVPTTEQEARELLTNTFGAGVVFKPVDGDAS